jgi:alpha-tubulin suppressor-like RCC1 family protein
LVNGGVKCWGDNGFGQLGDGSSTTTHATPTDVSGLTSGVQAISAGQDHTCALTNGAVKCWGKGDFAQLGDGIGYGSSATSMPVSVTGLANVRAISAGFIHTCAVDDTGSASVVKCWGGGASGQLGNGLFNDSASVVSTSVSGGVTSHAAGIFHTCAVIDGVGKCWGAGGSSRLGNGTSDSSTPLVAISAGAQSITAGEAHSCAIVNGAAKCWGYNNEGQVGNGTSGIPVTGATSVSGGLGGMQGISAGAAHTCALTDAGIHCWGNGSMGKLGNGSTSHSNVPFPSAL